jgi:hypothetical protein
MIFIPERRALYIYTFPGRPLEEKMEEYFRTARLNPTARFHDIRPGCRHDLPPSLAPLPKPAGNVDIAR